MAKSKRHHYIPQFFLRGFTNEAGEYFIYDKIKDEIRKSKPINTFFENKRNTGRLGNTEDDFLENLYARFDTRTAPFIEELRKMTSTNYTLHPETLARLKMFIPQLFWRIPKNDENLERIIDSIPFEATGFKIVNHEGKPVSHDIQSKLKDVDYFNKSVDKYINLTNRLLRRFYRGFSNDLENVRNSLLCVIILSNNPCQKQR